MLNQNKNLTPAKKKYKKILYTILLTQTLLTILKFTGPDYYLPINELLLNLILTCGICYLNFCLIAFYCIFFMFNMIQYFVILGRMVQNYIKGFFDFFGSSSRMKFYYSVVFVNFVFGFFFCWVFFRAYRFLKVNAVNEIKGGYGNRSNFGNFESEKKVEIEEIRKNGENGKNGFNAFQGKGMRIGYFFIY